MTLSEICSKYSISKEEIESYENNGLIVRHSDGNYVETDFEYLGKIKYLLSAGMDFATVQIYLQYLVNNDKENQIRLLRLFRARLIEKIHTKQQDLDRIDYTIYQLSKR